MFNDIKVNEWTGEENETLKKKKKKEFPDYSSKYVKLEIN